jgi:hypothetical protein
MFYVEFFNVMNDCVEIMIKFLVILLIYEELLILEMALTDIYLTIRIFYLLGFYGKCSYCYEGLYVSGLFNIGLNCDACFFITKIIKFIYFLMLSIYK